MARNVDSEETGGDVRQERWTEDKILQTLS